MNKKYILYIKKKCTFCIKATDLLRTMNISFDVISFDNRPKVLKEIKKDKPAE